MTGGDLRHAVFACAFRRTSTRCTKFLIFDLDLFLKLLEEAFFVELS